MKLKLPRLSILLRIDFDTHPEPDDVGPDLHPVGTDALVQTDFSHTESELDGRRPIGFGTWA